MKKVLLLGAALALAATPQAFAQSLDDLKNDANTPGDVLTYGMGYDLKRYSKLDQINRDTVNMLVPAWSYSLADNRGQEASVSPLKASTCPRIARSVGRRSMLDAPKNPMMPGILGSAVPTFSGSSNGPPWQMTIWSLLTDHAASAIPITLSIAWSSVSATFP